MKVFENTTALAAATLTAGQIVQTKGYTTAGDGGGATYLIKTAAAYAGTPDEYGDHTLANGNVAVLQGTTTLNVLQFGAKPDKSADAQPAIQAAVDRIGNAYDNVNETAGKRSQVVYIPEGDYLMDGPILLYGKDGMWLKGDGPQVTRLHSNSTQASFTYPAEWQALAGFANYTSNPAFIQIAKVRSSIVGSLSASGTSFVYTDSARESDPPTAGAAFFTNIEGLGFYARGTAYDNSWHGIYGEQFTSCVIRGIFGFGINTVVRAEATMWSSIIEDVVSNYNVKSLYIPGATSLNISKVNSVLDNEGMLVRASYSHMAGCSVDHWGYGSYAYDLGGNAFTVSGCGCELGLGGVLKVTGDRTGIVFDSCQLSGTYEDGAVNYTGQTSVADMGVSAIHYIEDAHVTFRNCVVKSQIRDSVSTITFLGASVVNKAKVVFELPSDPASGSSSPKAIFSDNVTSTGTLADGMPKVYFASAQDRVYASARVTSDIDVGNINTTYRVVFDTIDFDTHSMWDSVNKFFTKNGGLYKVSVTLVVNGDSFSYQAIQVTNRAAGFSNILNSRYFPTASGNYTLSWEEVLDINAGDSISLLSRYSGSGAANLIIKAGTSICIEQIA